MSSTSSFNKNVQTFVKKNPQTTASLIILLALLEIVLLGALVVTSSITLEKVKNEFFRSIELINGSHSGLFELRDGGTVYLNNTGVVNISAGIGIIVTDNPGNIYEISVNETDLNCTAICGDPIEVFLSNCTCFHNYTFVGSKTIGDCDTCDNSSCTCFNSTSIVNETDVMNITNSEQFNVTVFTNASCCTDNFFPGIGISFSGIKTNFTIKNDGLLNLSLTTPLVNLGSPSIVLLNLFVSTNVGLNISYGIPDILTNTGVLQGEAGHDIFIQSTYNNGTGILNVSAVANEGDQTTFLGGLGINVTSNMGINTVTNNGVIQDIQGPGINLTSSFNNGKGIVTVTNNGVYNVSNGTLAMISGPYQYPIISSNQTLSFNALTGIQIFQNSSSEVSILNTGVTSIVNGKNIFVNRNNLNVIVNVSSFISNVTAGNAIYITGNSTSPTINMNYTGGKGIIVSLTGANRENITMNLAAGGNITLTGTHPITISGVTSGFITSITSANNGLFIVKNGLDFLVYSYNFSGFSAVLNATATVDPTVSKLIGYNAHPAVWTVTPNANYPYLFNSAPDTFDVTNARWTVGFTGTYFVSWTVQSTIGTYGFGLCKISPVNPNQISSVTYSNVVSNTVQSTGFLRSSGIVLGTFTAGDRYGLCTNILSQTGVVLVQPYYAFGVLNDNTAGPATVFSVVHYPRPI